ncbi:hypothetical protein LQW54_005723, partial [Pestalotiopsis sp. IQ-011]
MAATSVCMAFCVALLFDSMGSDGEKLCIEHKSSVILGDRVLEVLKAFSGLVWRFLDF